MIDLHTHTLLSDGELLPAELAQRANEKGYKVIAFTDHVDYSNIDIIVPALVRACEKININYRIKAIPGVEITHVNPIDIPNLAKISRNLGAKIVVVHGETIVEPVAKGTNKKALESDIDILAHPGILGEDEAKLAVERNIHIEISARKGHSLSNGHIVRLWYEYGFPLILNTDTHSPEDLITDEFAKKLIISAGVKVEDVNKILNMSYLFAKSKLDIGFEI
ncbi:MAG: histidinol phosphate phosphatase domain-containing protein [Candidatus Omnitrophica bacterium]|nr:histidinol phosphate phosphatase domain-containing protein [Candidatus Omnitrophota bacterium]MCM8808160.1 histidinol phosphate phosphatase domain-containing protein [Candidatus Omnitrophota bacterium]